VLRMKMNRAHARLLSQCERVMSHAPGNGQVTIRPGRPVEAIAAAAREWNPDLIVMAAPLRRRIDVLIGTTAERVIRATQRPLLLVSGATDKPYSSIVLATDLSPAATHATRAMTDMGLLAHARAWIVHAFQLPYRDILAAGPLLEEEAGEQKREWHLGVRRELMRALRKAGIEMTRVSVAAEEARPFQAIQRTVDLVHPELLVIGITPWFMLKRVLFGSVADQVFRNIDCDILAIAPPANRRAWLRAA